MYMFASYSLFVDKLRGIVLSWDVNLLEWISSRNESSCAKAVDNSTDCKGTTQNIVKGIIFALFLNLNPNYLHKKLMFLTHKENQLIIQQFSKNSTPHKQIWVLNQSCDWTRTHNQWIYFKKLKIYTTYNPQQITAKLAKNKINK